MRAGQREMTVSVNFSDVASDADDATESGSGGAISNIVNIAIDSYDIPVGGAVGTVVDVAGILYDQSSNGLTMRDVYQGIGEFVSCNLRS